MVAHQVTVQEELWTGFQEVPLAKSSARWRELDDSIDPNHRARAVDRVVDQLDLQNLRRSYSMRGKKTTPA